MGTGFAKKKKEAKLMQAQLSKLQSDMKNIEVTGSAGNGLVSISLNGDNEMTQIRIKPDCIDKEDPEGLQDLIKAAYKDANEKLKKESMKGMPPGMGSLF